MSLIGAKVLRKEDPNLITGQGQYVDDLAPAGCAFMAMVRSTEPHARIVAVDTSAARSMDGVLAVWTSADIAGLPARPSSLPGMDMPLITGDAARFVGDIVAVVVATDRYTAADAAEAVIVDYEPLPAVASLAQALAADAPMIHPVLQGNTVFFQDYTEDLSAEFAAAPRTASLSLVNNRCAPVPIEPNVVLADWGPAGLTVWAAFQAPRSTSHRRSSLPQRCRVRSAVRSSTPRLVASAWLRCSMVAPRNTKSTLPSTIPERSSR
jgi:carbon-monoxide dehydrogenase large subunit